MLFIYRSCVSNTRRFSILIASPCAELVNINTRRQSPSIPPTRRFLPTSKIGWIRREDHRAQDGTAIIRRHHIRRRFPPYYSSNDVF